MLHKGSKIRISDTKEQVLLQRTCLPTDATICDVINICCYTVGKRSD